jgi:FKBP-type peptidyl-prolyl cis-trans isomerase 2
MPIKKGDKVKVEYKGTLDDGSVFDSSEGREPLEFEAGSGQVIAGFDEAVIGMEKGESKTVHIKADDAYGQPNPELKRDIPRDSLSSEVEPKEGMMLALNAPDGRQMPAKIVKVTDKTITIDLNHPLAGKDLNFEIKVV